MLLQPLRLQLHRHHTSQHVPLLPPLRSQLSALLVLAVSSACPLAQVAQAGAARDEVTSPLARLAFERQCPEAGRKLIKNVMKSRGNRGKFAGHQQENFENTLGD